MTATSAEPAVAVPTSAAPESAVPEAATSEATTNLPVAPARPFVAASVPPSVVSCITTGLSPS